MRFIINLFTTLSLRFRALTIVLVGILLTLGVVAANELNQELLPPIELPQTFVLVQASGMTSDEVLTVLTARVEKELDTIDDIINIESNTTGSFGAFITAYNDFGLNQENLRNDIQAAIDRVWLPQRQIDIASQDARNLLGELTPETIVYLADTSPNFLFQLSPQVWEVMADNSVEAALVYLAGQTDAAASATSALEQLVNTEVVPQLRTIETVANVTVEGGQTLPGEENIFGGEVEEEARSLLLSLSPEVWDVVSDRVDGVNALNQSAVDTLSEQTFTIPETAPSLPESWQAFDHFNTADDLLEIETGTDSLGKLLTTFYEDGTLSGVLGQTDDLTVETVNKMLEIEPAMVNYFEADQLVAMAPDVLDVILASEGFIESMDGFTRDQIAAAALAETITGETVERPPVDLPDPWLIQSPSIITFSFTDIPLAAFNVTATGTIEQAAIDGKVFASLLPQTDDEPPALPDVWSQLGETLGGETDTADDLLNVELPEQSAGLFGGDSLNAAAILNLVGAPPANIAPMLNMMLPVDPAELIGSLTPEVITYLAAQEDGFIESLEPGVFALFNDDVRALDIIPADMADTPDDAPSVEEPPVEETIEEGPALNDAWGLLSEFLGSEIDTADDLLRLPGGFTSFMNQLASSEEATGQLGDLIGGLPVDAVEFILENQPDAFDTLSEDALRFISDDVLALLPEDVQERTPRPLGDAWDLLASQPQFADQPIETAQDIVALGDGQPSSVLNTIDENIPAEFDSYEVRLFNSLSPSTIDVWLREEPAFWSNLNPEIIVQFSQETIQTVPEDILADLDNDVADTVRAIASGEQDSAFAELQALYTTNIAPADPDAPALNPQWSFLESAYQIELDSADDFFRFPEGYSYEDAAALINSLFDSAQGANFAPALLGNMPVEAMEYIVNRDVTVLQNLSARALQLFSEDVLALLPEDLQQRAAEGGEQFTPESQVTRTNGQPSLFVTVFKDADANTVSTFADVEDLMLNEIDASNDDIEVGIIFEQSSFIEESISGVVREGSLGAVFAIIIILIFLSSGTWNLKGRRRVGAIMLFVFLALLLGLVMLGYENAGNDFGEAFAQADVVVRVLLIAGIVAGAVIMIWPGKLPDPAWRATIVIGVSIPLSILTALVGMHWVSPAMYGVLEPLAEDSGFFNFLIRLFPEELTMNIMTLSGLTVAIGRVVDDSIVVLENIFRNLEMSEITSENKRQAVLEGTRDVSAAIFVATLIAMVVFLPLGLTGGIIGAFFLPFGLAVTYALAGSFIVAVTVVPVLAYLFIDPDQIPDEGDMWIANYYRPVLRLALSSNLSKYTVLALAFASMIFGFYLFGQRPFAFLPDFGEPQISVNVELPPNYRITQTNELVRKMEQEIDNIIPEDTLSSLQVTVGGGGAGFEALIGGGGSISENAANLTVILEVGVTGEELNEYTQQIREAAEQIFNGEDNVTVSSASLAEGGFGGLTVIASGPPEDLAELDPLIIETMNGIDGITNVTSNLSATGSSDGPPTYIRINLESALSYTGELETENTIGVTQDAIAAIKALPEVQNNENVTISQGFSSEIQTEGFNSLPIAMGLAIIIVVIILIFTMQSLVYWLSIILSVMVAPVGAAIALTLSERVLGISALIGLLMLIGLVITNAVVLIDRVLSNRRERGMDMQEALIEAGGRRLRPILMTSLATIIALTPLAIGLSEGAIIAAELGTVVIGGVFSSTLLTLIVVPVAFSLLYPLHRRLSVFGKSDETKPTEQTAAAD